MAGIYIHIPFCRKACHYCDFHFSTSLKTKEVVINGIIKEALLRKNELLNKPVETIYLGGGTPSLLLELDLTAILKSVHKNYDVHPQAEVTLEANPEDITQEKIIEWRSLGINRLSIGIQSFDEEVLTWMNRSHNSEQALNSVKTAQKYGIENISIDLIYGVPQRSLADWENEITLALELGTPHISSYCLTIEPQTVFGHKAAKGEILSSPNEQSSLEFLNLVDMLTKEKIELYEVSNFSKKGYESKHNSNYWNGVSFIGLGPGAHSYVHGKRSWNVSHNMRYAKGIEKNETISEFEELSKIDRYNEYIMTNIRRREGINLVYISETFGLDILSRFSGSLTNYTISKDLIISSNSIFLSTKGFLLADRIASDLFLTHE